MSGQGSAACLVPPRAASAIHSECTCRWDRWIDIDEKWFYVVVIKGFVWVLPDYMDPSDICSIPVASKRYITKVMFLIAVSRPRVVGGWVFVCVDVLNLFC